MDVRHPTDTAATAPVRLRQGEHKGWDAWWIERGPLALALVPQVGGRVMSMQWRGHDIAFTMAGLEGQVAELAADVDVRARKRMLGWLLWGGEKTWLAPQPGWTDDLPFLDLDSGGYTHEILVNDETYASVRMTSPTCRETGIEISRTVTVSADSATWTVSHRITNRSDEPATWAVWDVSMLTRPGRVYLPVSGGSEYPGGLKTFDDVGASVARRPAVVESDIGVVAVDYSKPGSFKYGVDADEGWSLGVFRAEGGLVGHVKQVPVFPGATYGHGCISEVYNAGDLPYLEMEMHGPIVVLAPDETFELVERATLFDVTEPPTGEADVRVIVAPIVDAAE